MGKIIREFVSLWASVRLAWAFAYAIRKAARS